MPALAISNNDTVFIAWSLPKKIPGCLGFSIHRMDDAKHTDEAVPALVGWAGGTNPNWKAQTTDQFPIQK